MISVAGVTVGTALLVIVLSVFNGFFDVIQSLLRTYDPDVRIEAADAPSFRPDPTLFAVLDGIPELQYRSLYVEGKCLLVYEGSRDKVVSVVGIDPKTYFPLAEKEKRGEMRIPDLGVRDRSPGMLIGDELRAQLSVAPGDRIALLSPDGVRRSLTQFSGPRYYTFDMRGAFTLASVYDGSIVYVEIEAAQRLFNLRQNVSGIDLRLSHPDHADAVKARLQAQLGETYRISTWYDLQKPLYDVMYLEKWAAYVILSLIVAIAVLNIVGSLTMIVIQKQRDIGVLMSMGFTSKQVRRIFLFQGLYIGLIGSVLGGGAGLLVSYIQQRFEIVRMTGSSSFLIDAYPVAIVWTDIAAVVTVTLILCLLASAYPAKRASAIQPASAVRYE